jgi:hypothetical protein
MLQAPAARQRRDQARNRRAGVTVERAPIDRADLPTRRTGEHQPRKISGGETNMGNRIQRIVLAVIGVLAVIATVFHLLYPTSTVALTAQMQAIGAMVGACAILFAGQWKR